MITQEMLRAHRRQICKNLKQLLRPHCKESGYRVRDGRGGSTPMLVWHEKKRPSDPKSDVKVFRIRGSMVIDEFEGLTPTSLVEEFYLGAVTLDFKDLPIEDLIKLQAWVLAKFAK